MISIRFEFPYRLLIAPGRVVATAHKTLTSVRRTSELDLTVFFCKKRTIHELNARYRKIDHPTDVLAFSYGKTEKLNSNNYLGDVIIAVPVARRQARENHHTLVEEVDLLVVHGILHLFGFDHESPRDRSRMWNKQEEILRNL